MDPDDQGTKSNKYAVIPRCLVFVMNGDYILLLKGSPSKRLWANQYNGIGGHIEPGENPLQAAHRELWEETGLTVDQLDLKAVIHITMPQSPGVMLFVFLGEADSMSISVGQEGTPEWVLKTEYQDLDLVEDLFILLPKILEQEPLFFGSYILNENGLNIAMG